MKSDICSVISFETGLYMKYNNVIDIDEGKIPKIFRKYVYSTRVHVFTLLFLEQITTHVYLKYLFHGMHAFISFLCNSEY
jgi:hypothetical protein